jgi:O-acetylhomoserine/O-acetylserine sulfhydrylase-like pyridoxal-dependent enzyme
VIHSCTKFLGGHSDILAGSVSVKNQELEDKIWQARKLVRSQFAIIATMTGLVLMTHCVLCSSAVSFRPLTASYSREASRPSIFACSART